MKILALVALSFDGGSFGWSFISHGLWLARLGQPRGNFCEKQKAKTKHIPPVTKSAQFMRSLLEVTQTTLRESGIPTQTSHLYVPCS